MQSAAPRLVPDTSIWEVQSDGALVANVISRPDGAEIVVTAEVFHRGREATVTKPHRFADADAASSFVGDLVASFAYLGCQVSRP